MINKIVGVKSSYPKNCKDSLSVNFKGEEKPKTPRRDIYSEMPLRLLGYSNELGEAIRPLSPMLANLSWLPAIGYISADIADKYRQDENEEKKTSKGRASKQFVNQMLSSVLLPTAAVKSGQIIANNISAFDKSGLNFNDREQVSNVVINSIKSGNHKNYTNPDGNIDIEGYKNSISEQMDEILKHRKTHKKLSNPIEMMVNYLKKPFIKKPSAQKVKTYAGVVAERMIADRQQLLSDIQPNALSNKTYKKFMKVTKGMSLEEKQSVAYNTIRKLEKGRMFNNRILKSVGGLVSLGLMAKPIDKFVEKVVVDKYVSPQIDNISLMYYRQLEEQRKRKEGRLSLNKPEPVQELSTKEEPAAEKKSEEIIETVQTDNTQINN